MTVGVPMADQRRQALARAQDVKGERAAMRAAVAAMSRADGLRAVAGFVEAPPAVLARAKVRDVLGWPRHVGPMTIAGLVRDVSRVSTSAIVVMEELVPRERDAIAAALRAAAEGERVHREHDHQEGKHIVSTAHQLPAGADPARSRDHLLEVIADGINALHERAFAEPDPVYADPVPVFDDGRARALADYLPKLTAAARDLTEIAANMPVSAAPPPLDVEALALTAWQQAVEAGRTTQSADTIAAAIRAAGGVATEGTTR